MVSQPLSPFRKAERILKSLTPMEFGRTRATEIAEAQAWATLAVADIVAEHLAEIDERLNEIDITLKGGVSDGAAS